MDEKQWLSISIFCEKPQYHNILRECISPLLKNLSETLKLNAWFIEFNTHKGDHIKIPILVPALKSGETAATIKKNIVLYFNSLKCTHKKQKQSANELFQPFPPNTVQFGLYDLPCKGLLTKEYEFKQMISEVFLEALADDEIDEEKIVTLTIYLHFVILKCFSEAFPDDTIFFETYCNSLQSRNKDQAILSFLNKKVKENQFLTFEIAKEILFSKALYEELGWLSKWNIFCMTTLSSSDGHETAILLIDLLNKQLNISSGLFDVIQLLVSSTWPLIFLDNNN